MIEILFELPQIDTAQIGGSPRPQKFFDERGHRGRTAIGVRVSLAEPASSFDDPLWRAEQTRSFVHDAGRAVGREAMRREHVTGGDVDAAVVGRDVERGGFGVEHGVADTLGDFAQLVDRLPLHHDAARSVVVGEGESAVAERQHLEGNALVPQRARDAFGKWQSGAAHSSGNLKTAD